MEEHPHKASIRVDVIHLKALDEYIGHLPIEEVHMDSLKNYVFHRKRKNNNTKQLKKKTINYGLQVVRRILNLAEQEWKDEYGLSWLIKAPKIKLEKLTDTRKPYPLSHDEQIRFFKELPIHLKRMALFAVNTGCRDKEICSLKWEWEIKIPEGSVFLIPEWRVKNREETCST